MDDPLSLGGGRFALTREPGPPPAVVKTGPEAPLAHEAAALALLAGVPGVPALIAHSAGRLVMAEVDGAPRDLAAAGDGDLRELGRLLARVHARGVCAAAALPWWPSPETTAAGYAARRAEGAARALADAGHPVTVAVPRCEAPFRPVHGDLVAANIVWGPAPHLVDWEFWRWGDPAEDLAYLAEANGLDDARLAAVLDGHGNPAVAGRVPGWRPVAAAETAAWWLGVGRADLAAPLLAALGR
ncbi:MAG: phosphotransferase [Thermoleophilia bacterium]